MHRVGALLAESGRKGPRYARPLIVASPAITCGYPRFRSQRDGSGRGPERSCSKRSGPSCPAFGVDTVRINALADQVGLDRSGTALGQLLVVGVRADRVGVADGDDRFQIDALGLLGNLIQQLAAFRLQRRLVEVEERVSVEDDLGGLRGRLGLLLRNRNAVAAGDAGGRGPEGVAPAQFVRTVLPNVTERVAPVVHRVGVGLGRGYTEAVTAAKASARANLEGLFMFLLVELEAG